MNAGPQRIQLSRAKGWRKPPNTVVVSRPHAWGNPYRLGAVVADPVNNVNPVAQLDPFFAPPRSELPTTRTRTSMLGERWEQKFYVVETRQQAVDLFRRLCEFECYDVSSLRGKNLACWCPLDQPCHADVLLELANASEADDA